MLSRVARRHAARNAAIAGLALGLICVGAANAPAQIFSVANGVLLQPSLLTRQTMSGLFTSIAAAGSRLIAVGQDGRIVLSDDDGKSWRQVETPTSVLLTGVAFASPQIGWATGQMGVILYTKDGGDHWALQFDGVRAIDVLMKSAEMRAAAMPSDAAAQQNLQNAKEFESTGPSLPFLTLLPTTAGTVVAAGGFGMAFASADNGHVWQSLFDDIPNPNGLHIYAVIADNESQIWIGEQGLVLRRDQTGKFTTLTTPFPGTLFGGLRTPDGTLLLYGLQGTVLRSTDNGASWLQVQTVSRAGIDCGIVMKNHDILLGSLDGELLVSHDEGKSFAALPTAAPITDLYQADADSIVTTGASGIHIVPVAAIASVD